MAVSKLANTAAAVTKIQAIARGNRDRKRAEAHASKVIEAMMEGKEPPKFQPLPPMKSPPRSSIKKDTSSPHPYASPSRDEDSERDESDVEEEIIYIDEEEYTDHTREELLAEIVTYEESEQAPAVPAPPPKKKSAFELYNEQLKASAAKPKPKPVPPPAKPKVEAKPEAAPESPEPTTWRGKLKRKLSWKSKKVKPEDALAAAAAKKAAESKEEEKPEPEPEPLKPAKPMSMQSTASMDNSSHHIRKTAAGWWGSKAKPASESSKSEAVAEDSTEKTSGAAKLPANSAHSTDDSMDPEKPSSMMSFASENSSDHIRTTAAGWWGAKAKPKTTSGSKPEVVIEASQEFSSSETGADNPIAAHFKKLADAESKMGGSLKEEAPDLDSTEGTPVASPTMQNRKGRASILDVKKAKPSPIPTKAVLETPEVLEAPKDLDGIAPDGSSQLKSSEFKRKPVALPSWVKKEPADGEADESSAPPPPPVSRSPVAMPKWLKKEPPSEPTVEGSEGADESTPAESSQEEAGKPPKPRARRPSNVKLPKWLQKEEHSESKGEEGDDLTPAESPKENPMPRRSSKVSMPSWVKTEENSESHGEDTDEVKPVPVVAKRSPVAYPKWLKKVPKEPPLPPGLEAASDSDEEENPAKPTVVERSPVAMPKWAKKMPSNAAPLPLDTDESGQAAKEEESPPDDPPETLQSTAADKSEMEDKSSDHKSSFAVPWLKPKTPATPEASESSDISPSPGDRSRSKSPPRPRRQNKLVNRYLQNVLDDTSEHDKRMAEIEADRARGRWDGTGYRRGDGSDGDGSNQKKWKYQQPKAPDPAPEEEPKEEEETKETFNEDAAIKIQAIARGFLARRRVAKYVDALIEEMMKKLNAAQMEALAKRREEEEAERRRQEEIEAKRRQEEEERLRKIREAEEEERRRKEEEEIRRRMYDQRYGLPLWWLELVPHNKRTQKEYDALIKKDNGATVIDYKLPPRNASLEAVTEEESEDENDANLDKILGDNKTKEKKKAKQKKKGGIFSRLFRSDTPEGVEPSSGNNAAAPNVALDTNKNVDDLDEDEDDTETPEWEQESAPAVTKIWM